ncbi:winged helix-turn-helix transcriptional regulator, partial [Salmonella enterica]|uniref:winged helix-turn-helix transcriptional regulator n=1 Tax=Salmonella enterica TaxID=28901 RepID=UPI003211AE10
MDHILSRHFREVTLFAEQFPSREVLTPVTSRLGVLILAALRAGTHRFSDLLREDAGVRERMLAQSCMALSVDSAL